MNFTILKLLLLIGWLSSCIGNLVLIQASNNNGETKSSSNVQPSLKIISLGDWGSNDFITYNISKFVEQENNKDAILLLGDNFYPIGVSSAKDPLWQSIFEKPFKNVKNTPFYVVSGNHDYYGNVLAQIDYAKNSNKWHFPSLYYSKMIHSKKKDEVQELTNDDNDGKVSVFLIVLDTWTLNGGDAVLKFNPITKRTIIRSNKLLESLQKSGELDDESADYIKSNYKADDAESTFGGKPSKPVIADEKQYLWLADQLNSKEAHESDFVIVAGHFPIYSACCAYGTKKLIDRLRLILEQFNNKNSNKLMYFYGHDHILQLIKRDNLNYYGSGAGGKKFGSYMPTYEGLMVAKTNNFGYMYHEFTKTSVKTTFVNSINGKRKETFSYVQEKQSSSEKEIDIEIS